MAWGRKKSGGRREPQFGLAASLSELRLAPQDRIPAAADEAPKKSSAKRKTSDTDNDAPPDRKPRANRVARKHRSSVRARSAIYPPAYWGAVRHLSSLNTAA